MKGDGKILALTLIITVLINTILIGFMNIIATIKLIIQTITILSVTFTIATGTQPTQLIIIQGTQPVTIQQDIQTQQETMIQTQLTATITPTIATLPIMQLTLQTITITLPTIPTMQLTSTISLTQALQLAQQEQIILHIIQLIIIQLITTTQIIIIITH